jgi:hypothetical protein
MLMLMFVPSGDSQWLQNKVLNTAGSFLRCMLARDLYMAYKLLYNYITKLYRQHKITKLEMFATSDKVKPNTV